MFDDRIAAANSKLSRMKMFDNEEKKESCGSDPAGTECKYGGEYGEARQDLFGFEGKDCCDSDEEMIVCGQGWFHFSSQINDFTLTGRFKCQPKAGQMKTMSLMRL